MNYLLSFSDSIIPIFVVVILVFACIRKVNGYDVFIKGAESGFQTVLQIMPTLTGLMVAVAVLRASGCMEFFGNVIGSVTKQIGFQQELVPLILIKYFSSSAATGVLLDIFQQYGPDSEIGKTASIMMSCTETIFYTMSIYFMTVKVKKTRWTLPGALVASSIGIMMSILLAKKMG